jgi:hypothetical protein
LEPLKKCHSEHKFNSIHLEFQMTTFLINEKNGEIG